MKCKYVREVHEPREAHHGDERLVQRDGQFYWPVGTVEEHPNAWVLVRNGVAEPDDDECRLAAAMSTRDMQAAQRQANAVSKGIHPKDYQRFFDGEIEGYDVDGNEIPGPNYIERSEEDDDD